MRNVHFRSPSAAQKCLVLNNSVLDVGPGGYECLHTFVQDSWLTSGLLNYVQKNVIICNRNRPRGTAICRYESFIHKIRREGAVLVETDVFQKQKFRLRSSNGFVTLTF